MTQEAPENINRYLSIGEFAKARNTTVKAIRYYEKKKLIQPAYINEATGYRYYSSDQLWILDAIATCKFAGIPLEELQKFFNENGELQFESLLQFERDLALKQIQTLRAHISKLERTLNMFEIQRQCRKFAGVYSRRIEERYIVTMDCQPDMEAVDFEVSLAQLIMQSQKAGIEAIRPAGIIFNYRQSRLKARLFAEVFQPLENSPLITTLPAGLYKCIQGTESVPEDPWKFFKKEIRDQERAMVICSSVPAEIMGQETPFEYQLFDDNYVAGPEEVTL